MVGLHKPQKVQGTYSAATMLLGAATLNPKPLNLNSGKTNLMPRARAPAALAACSCALSEGDFHRVHVGFWKAFLLGLILGFRKLYGLYKFSKVYGTVGFWGPYGFM